MGVNILLIPYFYTILFSALAIVPFREQKNEACSHAQAPLLRYAEPVTHSTYRTTIVYWQEVKKSSENCKILVWESNKYQLLSRAALWLSVICYTGFIDSVPSAFSSISLRVKSIG